MEQEAGGMELAAQMERLRKAFEAGDYFEMARGSDELYKLASAKGWANVAGLARSVNKGLNGLVLPTQAHIDGISDALSSEMGMKTI